MRSVTRRRFGVALFLACLAPWPAHANQHLTVLLDWFVNPNHAPLIIAKAIGAFTQQGLDVDFIEPADPTMPPKLVAAGHGDIAIDYQPQLYLQVAQQLDVIRIGTLIDKPLSTLTTLEEDGINSIADLKGKRIGYNNVSGDIDIAEIALILKSAHLGINDVTLVNIGPALSTSLLAHRVDAVSVDRNFETFELIMHGAKPHGFNFEDFGVPPWDDLIIVVQRTRAHEPAFARFLHAVRMGQAYIESHPNEAWAAFIKLYPNNDNALNRAAWQQTLGLYAHNPFTLDRQKYINFGNFLFQQNLLTAPPKLDQLATELADPQP